MTIDQAGGVHEHVAARLRPASAERSFGISVGTVLLAIGAYLLWRGRLGRAEVIGALGALLLILGLLRPAVLKWPSMFWWRFARALGYVNVAAAAVDIRNRIRPDRRRQSSFQLRSSAAPSGIGDRLVSASFALSQS
jgi:hypothetical protein